MKWLFRSASRRQWRLPPPDVELSQVAARFELTDAAAWKRGQMLAGAGPAVAGFLPTTPTIRFPRWAGPRRSRWAGRFFRFRRSIKVARPSHRLGLCAVGLEYSTGPGPVTEIEIVRGQAYAHTVVAMMFDRKPVVLHFGIGRVRAPKNGRGVKAIFAIPCLHSTR